MCYSAMVQQGLKKGLRWQARIQTEGFEDLFRRRLDDRRLKVARALEANFDDPRTLAEVRIRQCIDQHREGLRKDHETELFRQRHRLINAERMLKAKETKKIHEEIRIAENKVGWLMAKLADLSRTTLAPEDSQIFPFWYAPLYVWEDGRVVVRPMRYHCRINGKPESYDRRYPGLYNARRDNLEGYWKTLFGHRHAVLVISSFFENVARHDFEHRAIRPGEKPENLVLHFDPQPPMEMCIACLWDRWQSPGRPDLYSFAAITDEPPPEIAATGHNRCVIPLKESHIRAWLAPEGRSHEELYGILDDRERPYYRHERAA